MKRTPDSQSASRCGLRQSLPIGAARSIHKLNHRGREHSGRGTLEAATVRQQCKLLRMPTIGAQCTQLAEQAVRDRRTHLGYLEALLPAELEEREQRLIERRIRGRDGLRVSKPRRDNAGDRLTSSCQHVHSGGRCMTLYDRGTAKSIRNRDAHVYIAHVRDQHFSLWIKYFYSTMRDILLTPR